MNTYWINIHYACFGIITKYGIVKEVAPIAKWMEGKSLQEIKQWLLNKNAVVKELK